MGSDATNQSAVSILAALSWRRREQHSMIRRVKVQGYKSLRNLEVHLQPLSVLFGPNATGKSNFLDCLQLLSRIATQRTVKEAFETPYRGKPLESFSFGPGGIEGLLGQDSASFSIEVDVELSPAVCSRVERAMKEIRGEKGRDTPVAIRRTNLRYGSEI